MRTWMAVLMLCLAAGCTCGSRKERAPTAYELQTADYTTLSNRSCMVGWDSVIVPQGATGRFDRETYEQVCTRRLTQVFEDCAKRHHNSSDIKTCADEQTGYVVEAALTAAVRP